MSSKIEWTEDTWNPVLGCDKVSDGCKNCYAIRMAYRLMHNPKMGDKYAGLTKKTEGGALNWTGKLNLLEDVLQKPLKTKKPTTYFVNSMSDLFHDDVPFDYILKVWSVMQASQRHTFQILTKRPARAIEFFHWLGMDIYIPMANVWIGVSVENQKAADERIPLLLEIPAAVRFLSCEPLLGPVDLNTFIKQPDGKRTCSTAKWLDGLHWVIVGGESGPGARPVHPTWAWRLREQCAASAVPFFFKQWGAWKPVTHEEQLSIDPKFCGVMLSADPSKFFKTFGSAVAEPMQQCFVRVGKHAAGRLLDEVEWNEMPKGK